MASSWSLLEMLLLKQMNKEQQEEWIKLLEAEYEARQERNKLPEHKRLVAILKQMDDFKRKLMDCNENGK